MYFTEYYNERPCNIFLMKLLCFLWFLFLGKIFMLHQVIIINIIIIYCALVYNAFRNNMARADNYCINFRYLTMDCIPIFFLFSKTEWLMMFACLKIRVFFFLSHLLLYLILIILRNETETENWIKTKDIISLIWSGEYLYTVVRIYKEGFLI